MPLSQLDPRAALVIIDLQNGIVALPTAAPVSEVVRRSAELAQGFRAHDLPVVLANVAGQAPGRTEHPTQAGAPPAGWTDLVPELTASEADLRVTKLSWGAFQDTPLEAHLNGLGVTQIVLTGIATSMGVESTARSAHERGYHVVVVTDATTDLDPEAHAHSVTRIFPAIGETTTTGDVLAALNQVR